MIFGQAIKTFNVKSIWDDPQFIETSSKYHIIDEISIWPKKNLSQESKFILNTDKNLTNFEKKESKIEINPYIYLNSFSKSNECINIHSKNNESVNVYSKSMNAL